MKFLCRAHWQSPNFVLQICWSLKNGQELRVYFIFPTWSCYLSISNFNIYSIQKNVMCSFQSSKGILRSNEISLPPSGLLDTELELTFSLQVGLEDVDGLVQDCGISIALAMEILQCCTEPQIINFVGFFFYDLMWDCGISITLAMEIPQSCKKP